MKQANPEELAAIKAHFKAVGYGDIADQTAHAQKQFLKAMRKGELVVVDQTTGRMEGKQ